MYKLITIIFSSHPIHPHKFRASRDFSQKQPICGQDITKARNRYSSFDTEADFKLFNHPMEIPQSRIYIIYSRATLLFYFLKWECEVKNFFRFNVIYFCRLLFEIGPGKVSPLPLGISGKM